MKGDLKTQIKMILIMKQQTEHVLTHSLFFTSINIKSQIHEEHESKRIHQNLLKSLLNNDLYPKKQ